MRLIMKVMMSLALFSAVPAFAAPLIIAHRGASGQRPEHTQGAYDLAITQGADFIEPDLVLTKDGALVVRHENEIGGTTTVGSRPEFAARKTTKMIDGASVTGWFTEDFTLAELKTLRARERLPELRPVSAKYDGQFPIMTLSEVIDFVRAREKATKRRIGIYPETKHPSYFASIGLSFDKPMLALLKRSGYSKVTDPLFIQSFEVSNLKRLRKATALRLVQLMSDEGGPADMPGITYASMATPAGLRTIATYANGIGVAKAMILPRNTVEQWGAPTTLVADAHTAGLIVHAWTFRAENVFLPLTLRSGPNPGSSGDLAAEVKRFAAEGVDGLFSDFPGEAVAAIYNSAAPPR
jgi:glycerophosphoryl diester phosphodiesterase